MITKLVWPFLGIVACILLIGFFESSIPLLALLSLLGILAGLRVIEHKL